MGTIKEHLMEDYGAPEDQVDAGLAPWTLAPIEDNGRVYGEYMMQNNEIHFALNKEARGKLGKVRLMRNFLRAKLDEHVFLTTRLFKGDKSRKLIEFFGFVKINEDAKFDYFWLDEGCCKWSQ